MDLATKEYHCWLADHWRQKFSNGNKMPCAHPRCPANLGYGIVLYEDRPTDIAFWEPAWSGMELGERSHPMRRYVAQKALDEVWYWKVDADFPPL